MTSEQIGLVAVVLYLIFLIIMSYIDGRDDK